MDSTFSWYSPGFSNFLVLTLILPFFRTGPDSFSALARIPPFANTRPDSTMFWYSHSFYPFSVLVPTFFGTLTDSFFCRYSPGFKNVPLLTLILPFFRAGPDSFPVLTLILPFFRTGPDSFKVLARIPPFPGSRLDSTIFWCSH